MTKDRAQIKARVLWSAAGRPGQIVTTLTRGKLEYPKYRCQFKILRSGHMLQYFEIVANGETWEAALAELEIRA